MGAYLRVSVKGALPSGEVWSVNPIFRPGVPAAIGPTEMAALVAALVNVTPPSTLTAIMNSTTTLTGVRVEARQADGSLERVGEGVKTTSIPGTGTSPHPFQTSMVFSLMTNDASGSGKGRLYWPATGVDINAGTLRVAAVTVGNALTGINSYLAGLRTAINSVAGVGTHALVVWSQKNGSGNTVTQLRAGDILDTQRRRRDKLIENYTAQAIT